MNGILIYKKPHSSGVDGEASEVRQDPQDSHGPQDPEDPQGSQDYYDCRTYRVYRRPHVNQFLTDLLKKYDVAIWTSTTHYNASRIVKWLIDDQIIRQLKFMWYRDRTKLHPDYGYDVNIKPYNTVKNLEDIWTCPTINGDRSYHQYNTIIIDDDILKMKSNDPRNYIITDESLTLDDTFINTIIAKFEDLEVSILLRGISHLLG